MAAARSASSSHSLSPYWEMKSWRWKTSKLLQNTTRNHHCFIFNSCWDLSSLKLWGLLLHKAGTLQARKFPDHDGLHNLQSSSLNMAQDILVQLPYPRQFCQAVLINLVTLWCTSPRYNESTGINTEQWADWGCLIQRRMIYLTLKSLFMGEKIMVRLFWILWGEENDMQSWVLAWDNHVLCLLSKDLSVAERDVLEVCKVSTG